MLAAWSPGFSRPLARFTLATLDNPRNIRYTLSNDHFPMAHDTHNEDSTYDADRYDSARGWKPREDPQARRLREAEKRKNPEQYCYEGMFEARPANDFLDPDDLDDRIAAAELIPGIWRTGEVALLIGAGGTGKSTLAVQLAESIARGRALEPFGRPSRLKVLYLDLQNSDDQFRRRYVHPGATTAKGRRPRNIRYKFSDAFTRIGYDVEGLTVPESFNRNFGRYLHHSLNLIQRQHEADVLIIDDLTSFDPRGGAAAALRTMRSLSLLAHTTGMGVLVLLTTPQARKGNRNAREFAPLNIPARLVEIAKTADTVLGLGTSTFAPDIRYLKHLACRTAPPIYHGETVFAYHLTRTTGPSPTPGPQAPSPASLPSSDPSLFTVHSSLFTETASPFLGFHFLGLSTEDQHLKDYAAEARVIPKQTQKPLNQRQSIVDMFLDPAYGRYLKGE